MVNKKLRILLFAGLTALVVATTGMVNTVDLHAADSDSENLTLSGSENPAFSMATFAPVFNPGYYLSRYPELAKTCGTDANLLFDHFIKHGMFEGRQGCADFNVLVYMKENEDLRKAFGQDIASYYMHYISRGMKEGRIASSDETKTYYDCFDDYMNSTVFIGDSIMLGYRNFCSRQSDYMKNIKFLCVGSYSLNNALKPVGQGSLHPIYQGEKLNVWNGVNKMQAKHVYIMFGTNDLAITGVDGTVQHYLELIKNIKTMNPDVDINIISMTYTVADYKGKGLNNDNIRIFNDKMKAICEANGYSYIDIASLIDDGNGNLKPGYCSDGFVHLNFSCYQQVWKPAFEKAAVDGIFNYVIN